MADLRSVVNTTSKAPDEHIEQLRQKIGTEFSDRKTTGKKRNEMGKDDFIRLMSAQLKYQDPTSPMKNEQMAAQLAQFSALEQMMNVNQNLEKMTAGQKPQENVLAASLIGKKVLTDSSRFSFQKGAEPDMKFELPVDAEATNVSVVDAKGEVIREYTLGAMPKGSQSVKWDGKNSKGQDASPGEYSIRVNASDAQSKPIQISQGTSGLVTGVVFEQGKPMLLVGEKKIPIEVVQRIENDAAASGSKAAGTKAASGVMPGNGAKNVTDDKQKTSINKDETVSKKNTNSEEKILQGENQGEKINTKEDALALAQRTSRDERVTEDEELGAYPFWNPNSN